MTSENIHLPVLLQEVLESFEPLKNKDAVLVDATLGGAGHSRALLEHFPQMKLLGCDYDIAAIDAANFSLHAFAGRIEFFHGNFKDVFNGRLSEEYGPPWDGILMDLGYSSNQLEDPTYGMSFASAADGPLDMRLSRPSTLPSAWDLILESSEKELAEIFQAYGEIPGAHRVATQLKLAINEGQITNSTRSLANYLSKHSRKGYKEKIHPATLVFQALRIAVNDELRNLDEFLTNAILNLRQNGRIAVITFHSLEDRIVKHWGVKNLDLLTSLTRKPVCATEEEARKNPRARSAKLRVFEKR